MRLPSLRLTARQVGTGVSHYAYREAKLTSPLKFNVQEKSLHHWRYTYMLYHAFQGSMQNTRGNV